MGNSDESLIAYAKRNKLALRYGIGLFLIVSMVAGSALQGDLPSVVLFKGLLGIVFAIAVAALPMLFDPVRSTTPFTPSFFERKALESICLMVAITALTWKPEADVTRTVLIALALVIAFFGAQLLLARFVRR